MSDRMTVPEPWELRNGPRDPVADQEQIEAWRELLEFCEQIIGDDSVRLDTASKAGDLEPEWTAIYNAITALEQAVNDIADGYGVDIYKRRKS